MRSHLIKIFESSVIELLSSRLKIWCATENISISSNKSKRGRSDSYTYKINRQYENKQQKSNQQRNYESQQTKKELNTFLFIEAHIEVKYVQSVMNDIEQFNEQFQNESFNENIVCEINNKEKNNVKVHNINKDVENKYTDEHFQYKNNFDIKHVIKKKRETNHQALSSEQKSILSQGRRLNDLHIYGSFQ